MNIEQRRWRGTIMESNNNKLNYNTLAKHVPNNNMDIINVNGNVYLLLTLQINIHITDD